jgi:mannonate dehydratase
MRLATVLTPMSSTNLALAAQCGVTDVVGRYPGTSLDDLLQMRDQIESYGMRLATVEGYLPIENMKLGRDDGTELAAMKSLLRNMQRVGVKILCYNFMAGSDWVRTRLDAPERGGAKVTAFSLAEVERARSLNQSSGTSAASEAITADQLWNNLERFLRELIPVAEETGVTMCKLAS